MAIITSTPSTRTCGSGTTWREFEPSLACCEVRTSSTIVRAMALKTPDRYLDEIRARDVRIFYRRQRFANPDDHPVAAPAASCVAETFAAALESVPRIS